MDNMNWRTSSYSSGNGGECIEVASPEAAVAIRDTKQNGTGPVLRFSPGAWRRFASQVKRSLASGWLPGHDAAAPGRVRVTRPVRPDSGPWAGRVSADRARHGAGLNARAPSGRAARWS
ncbi:MAG: DUF397 domain-containing protein [Streptosporangiaceae bacterium]